MGMSSLTDSLLSAYDSLMRSGGGASEPPLLAMLLDWQRLLPLGEGLPDRELTIAIGHVLTRIMVSKGLLEAEPKKLAPACLIATFCVVLHWWVLYRCAQTKSSGTSCLKCLQKLLCLLAEQDKLPHSGPAVGDICLHLLKTALPRHSFVTARLAPSERLKVWNGYRNLLLKELSRRISSTTAFEVRPCSSYNVASVLKHIAFRGSLMKANRDKVHHLCSSYLATGTYRRRPSIILYALLDAIRFLEATERQAFVDFTELGCKCEAKCFRGKFSLFAQLQNNNTVVWCKACGANLKFGNKKKDRNMIISGAYCADDLCYFCGHDSFLYSAGMYECSANGQTYSLRGFLPDATRLIDSGSSKNHELNKAKVTVYLMCSGEDRLCYNVQRFESLKAAMDGRSQCKECRSVKAGLRRQKGKTCLDLLRDEDEISQAVQGDTISPGHLCLGCLAYLRCACHDRNPVYIDYRARLLPPLRPGPVQTSQSVGIRSSSGMPDNELKGCDL